MSRPDAYEQGPKDPGEDVTKPPLHLAPWFTAGPRTTAAPSAPCPSTTPGPAQQGAPPGPTQILPSLGSLHGDREGPGPLESIHTSLCPSQAQPWRSLFYCPTLVPFNANAQAVTPSSIAWREGPAGSKCSGDECAWRAGGRTPWLQWRKLGPRHEHYQLGHLGKSYSLYERQFPQLRNEAHGNPPDGPL